MNNLELQALRHLLFFSVPEAALLVAASPERISGVQERTWRRWEDGTLVVPNNIAETMQKLCGWRDQALAAMRGAISEGRKARGELDIVLVWYDTVDDWASLAGREPILWRPQCSVIAEAVTLGARLVEFDSADYAQWLGKRADSEQMRGAWAAAR
ncbi:MAG: Aca2/YdiL-like domain-containing protein [Gallionellaceae bacterium]